MFVARLTTLILCCLTAAGFCFIGCPAHAQDLSLQQLQTLAPDTSDLQGFTHIRPAGTNPPRRGRVSPEAVVQDQVWPGVDGSQATDTGILRAMWARDGASMLEIRLKVCDTPEAARKEIGSYLQQSSGVFQKGTFSGLETIGDECWALPANIYGSTLIFRAGKMFVAVSGSQSPGSDRNGGPHFVFPPGAVEAVAYQCLLKASQRSELTGVSSQTAQMTVNGHALPKGALRVAGRVYVPVQAFAKALGLTSGCTRRPAR